MAVRLLFLLMISAVAILPAQQLPADQVPVAVRTAWAATQRGGVIWHAGPGRTYQAWFTARDVATRAHYIATGTLVETHVEIGAITMPPRCEPLWFASCAACNSTTAGASTSPVAVPSTRSTAGRESEAWRRALAPMGS